MGEEVRHDQHDHHDADVDVHPEVMQRRQLTNQRMGRRFGRCDVGHNPLSIREKLVLAGQCRFLMTASPARRPDPSGHRLLNDTDPHA